MTTPTAFGKPAVASPPLASVSSPSVSRLACLFIALTTLACPALAQERLDVGRFADAIYRTEGGAKTKHPYGIMSVKVSSAAEARKVCINTIRKNTVRWERAGQPGTFIEFLAGRYCPKSADPVGNVRWIKNMKKIYGEI